jgi:hypothetical protein
LKVNHLTTMVLFFYGDQWYRSCNYWLQSLRMTIESQSK